MVLFCNSCGRNKVEIIERNMNTDEMMRILDVFTLLFVMHLCAAIDNVHNTGKE